MPEGTGAGGPAPDVVDRPGRLRPLSDYVVVRKLVRPEEKTAAGLVVPTAALREEPNRGFVVATGPGRLENGMLVTCEAKPGDEVLFARYAGSEVQVGRLAETLLIMRAEDIMAVVEREEA